MVVCCKQKAAYEVRLSGWSSNVCSSDRAAIRARAAHRDAGAVRDLDRPVLDVISFDQHVVAVVTAIDAVGAHALDEGRAHGNAVIGIAGCAEEGDALKLAIDHPAVANLDVLQVCRAADADADLGDLKRVGQGQGGYVMVGLGCSQYI